MKNEGTLDRVVRLLAGLGLLAAGWFALGLGEARALGIAAAAVAVVLVTTAAIGFCPAYRLLGIRTCRTGA